MKNKSEKHTSPLSAVFGMLSKRRLSKESKIAAEARRRFGDPLNANQVEYDPETGTLWLRHSSNPFDGKNEDCIISSDEVVTVLFNRDDNDSDDIGGAIEIATDALTEDRIPYNKQHTAVFKEEAIPTIVSFLSNLKSRGTPIKEIQVQNDLFTNSLS